MVKKVGNSWYYDFTVRRVRYRESIPEARTKYQAQEAEKRIRDEVFEGKFGQTQSKVKFAEFAKDEYLTWAASKRSINMDRIHVKTLTSFFGSTALADISQITIERFKRQRCSTMSQRGALLKPASVNRELACLSKLLALARDNGFLAKVPKIKMLREDNQRTRYLSPDEETQLMKSLETSRKYLIPLVTFALNTGMRLSEITSLTWNRVDFVRGSIFVTNTKSGKARAVPMNEHSRRVLTSLHSKSERVFTSLPKRISLSFTKACEQAGIVDFSFHCLRHTFATRLADSGVDITTIAALLGHSNIQMSSRYTHPTDDRNHRAVGLLSAYNQKVSQESVKSIGDVRAAGVA